MSALPILYSFRRCPYAMRARMAIMISQRPVQLREVRLADKPDEMIALSDTPTVPLLVDREQVIEESLQVMHWALAQNDPENWLASADDPLIAQNDGPFKHDLDRYKYASRYDGIDAMAHRDGGVRHLHALEERLGKTAYLGGAQRSFVDIALFPFVRQFRIPDKDWFDALPLPHLHQWLSTLTGSALFLGVMEKYPVWKNTGEAFIFPDPAA
ncbi:MAG: glutathione S-transferase [Robiginitomaculum sp.]|nr:glutathione S-transferase [Robiginitomaculum sp.]MDQ7076763.1 glutathione S-transferase [Robiginitomaculum sp.]